ncbi:MAG: hypothetical protein M0Z94_19700 [Dehalococcoidales bacterium]|nr:hypothetical protein [Dehalococcoidales bacterium]
MRPTQVGGFSVDLTNVVGEGEEEIDDAFALNVLQATRRQRKDVVGAGVHKPVVAHRYGSKRQVNGQHERGDYDNEECSSGTNYHRRRHLPLIQKQPDKPGYEGGGKACDPDKGEGLSLDLGRPILLASQQVGAICEGIVQLLSMQIAELLSDSRTALAIGQVCLGEGRTRLGEGFIPN